MSDSSLGQSTPPSRSGTVLIIDDDMAVREVLQALLNQKGFRTLAAADGTSGVALYQEHRSEISVVMVDLVMPSTPGGNVIAALRALNPTLGIIGMTGSIDTAPPGDRHLMWLRKPSPIDEIVRAIETVA